MINELLKIASEDDTWGVENCEKLAAVDEVLGENFAMKEDFLKEQQEYLEDIDEKIEKIANIPGSLGLGGLLAGGIGQAAKSVGGAAAKGLGAAGLAGAGLLGTAVVNDLYTSARSALTKGKNFEKMIQADPELANYPADKVKAYFNTLHEKGGPEISGDPVISSAFVRQQLDFHGNILDNVTKMVGIREKLDKAHSVLPYGKLNFGG